MKINRIIAGFAFCSALFAMGCEADYQPDYQRVYINEATATSAAKLPVEPGIDTHTSLTVKLVSPQTSDVKLKLGLASSLITSYNETNGASYEVLPEEYLEYEPTVTIPAGETVASVDLLVKAFPTPNGENYALPFQLQNVEGPVGASATSSKYLVLLDKPLMQAVPSMTYASRPQSASINDATQDWNDTTNDWSLECWVWMSGFPINNQAIFNFKASKEIYIRFGDAPIPYNSLQIKYMGSQVNTPTLFTAKTWNHLAFIYSGASGVLGVYINGKLDCELQVDGGAVTFNGMTVIASGAQYFPSECRMAQVRLWKKALSATELSGNMLSSVRATDENLMGYWKMDEGTGTVLKDCSSNGRDLTGSGAINWIPDVRFDGK